jgi:hypothetical protein
MRGTIRIIACPPGEAPQAVREAWIGLELPLLPGRLGHRRGWLTTGVVSGPRTWWRRVIGILTGRVQAHSGYAVNGLEAIKVLALKDPHAATWWRDNCGHLLDGKRHLVFPLEVCQECQ